MTEARKRTLVCGDKLAAPPALIDEDIVVLSVFFIVLQSRTIVARPETAGATTRTARTSN